MAGHSRALALASGIAVDVALIDPPNGLHPVAWIGRAAALVERATPRGVLARRAYGLAAALVLPLVTFEVVRRAQRANGGHWLAAALLLALASSHRTLFSRVSDVADALEADDLPAARATLGRHLVSRDTAELDASEVSAAAIESLAENLSDGVIAPWVWFALGGAPLAWAYRVSNTLDAMWGYRNERYEDLGKAAALIDDGWNLLPARVTALSLCVAASVDGRVLRAARAWRRDAEQTASPNAGHPMSAIAGALDVRLQKRGEYDLNEGGRAVEATDIRRALLVARRASVFAAVLLVAGAALKERRA